MTLIFAETPETHAALMKWASARIPHLFGRELPPCQIAGVVRHQRVVAAVAFYEEKTMQDGWKTLNVSAAAESRHWARPPVLRAALHYAFVQAGADLLQAGTPHTNKETIQFLRHLGFKPDGVLRRRYGERLHAAMFSMTRHEWRKSRWFVEVS